MKGKVLFFDQANYTGTISGEDGNRYQFVKADWKAPASPTEGTEVDFSPKDGNAIDIFVIGKAVGGTSDKTFGTTLILAILLGGLGVHRFYTGHTGIGIIQIITVGGCGIWTIIDIISIATGKFVDSDGKPLKKN